jgi:hypothetical protein
MGISNLREQMPMPGLGPVADDYLLMCDHWDAPQAAWAGLGWAGSVILDGGGGASREHAFIVQIIVVVRASLVRALAGHVRHGLNTKVVLVINLIALDAEDVQCGSVSNIQTAAEDLVIGMQERLLPQDVEIISESMVQAKAVRIDEA